MIETCEAAVRNLDALMVLAYPEFRDELTIAVKTMHLIYGEDHDTHCCRPDGLNPRRRPAPSCQTN
jgi:hypothetical protein